jgi:hypothetical protein
MTRQYSPGAMLFTAVALLRFRPLPLQGSLRAAADFMAGPCPTEIAAG